MQHGDLRPCTVASQDGPGGLADAVAALSLTALSAGCGAALPDNDAQGARVLRERWAGCHRLYAPGSMTIEMSKLQVERMRACHGSRRRRSAPCSRTWPCTRGRG